MRVLSYFPFSLQSLSQNELNEELFSAYKMVLHKLDGFLWPFSVLYLNWLPLHVLLSLPWTGKTAEIGTLTANTVAYCLLSISHCYASWILIYLLLEVLFVFLWLGALHNVSGKRSVLYPCNTVAEISVVPGVMQGKKQEMSGHAWRTIPELHRGWHTTGKQDRWEQSAKAILLSQIIQARKSFALQSRRWKGQSGAKRDNRGLSWSWHKSIKGPPSQLPVIPRKLSGWHSLFVLSLHLAEWVRDQGATQEKQKAFLLPRKLKIQQRHGRRADMNPREGGEWANHEVAA